MTPEKVSEIFPAKPDKEILYGLLNHIYEKHIEHLKKDNPDADFDDMLLDDLYDLDDYSGLLQDIDGVLAWLDELEE